MKLIHFKLNVYEKSSMDSFNKIGNTILKKKIKFEIKQSGGFWEKYFRTFCGEELVCLL